MTALRHDASAATDLIRVPLGERSYDIRIGAGLLADVGEYLRPVLAQPRVAVVTDTTVAGLYLNSLIDSLDRADIKHSTVVLPPGEQTKDFAHLQHLIDTLLAARIERGTTLVALGGGVIGDITGFAAGVLLRGLGYVQIPTTLLAQVDSSVGGKTGINTRHGKNLVGLFHQPRLVVADVATLDTLDERQRRAGYAEVLKYGLINDADFFSWLEVNGVSVCSGERDAQRHAVLTSCTAKAGIVAADEREAGVRALLNLGHTFGHALEAEAGYGDSLLHGEAVAIGMAMAFRLSADLGLCPAGDAQRVRDHLGRIGLPADPSDVTGVAWSADSLVEHMTRDKKVQDGSLTFVLARGIGKAFIHRDVTIEQIRRLVVDTLGR